MRRASLTCGMVPPHWKAWLSAHPERDIGWLERAIAEGFEIHHVDGKHHNNDPANVVLIDAVDHRRLHGRFVIAKSRSVLINGELARKAYESREDQGYAWQHIGKQLRITGITAQKLARIHAGLYKLKWPLPVKVRVTSAWERPIYPDSRL